MISVTASVLPERDPTTPDLGGRGCLAVVNTEAWRRLSGLDKLGSPAEATALLVRTRHRTPEEAEACLAEAERDPATAAAALARLHGLRGPLHAVLWGLHEGRRPEPEDLAAIERQAAEALGHVRVRDEGDGFSLAYADPASHPFDALRLLAARSALAVLASPQDLAHLKRCEGERCGFLFVDDSRNQTRRWCDTRLCGNRARVKAHHRRRREGRTVGDRE
jgi:predicted RNA-binding Zn ribbon-like protein